LGITRTRRSRELQRRPTQTLRPKNGNTWKACARPDGNKAAVVRRHAQPHLRPIRILWASGILIAGLWGTPSCDALEVFLSCDTCTDIVSMCADLMRNSKEC
jgi:hypothetical protein